ncbi:MAG TPA: hypothetical protein VGB60_12410 [Brevundimonas sp.]|jgi:hypothetical protein|uniref:hypothetical protein n=1 Tax=Brevundimonas sp. TaxID=1871086 RepID=UPI002ED9D11F
MTRLSIGETLAARLFAAETAIDAALTESATLAAMLPSARADAYLSAVTGQRVFDEAAATITALSSARSHLVQTHNALAAVARKLGLDALASGPVDKPGDTPPIGGGGGDTTGAFPNVVNKTLPLSSTSC